MKQCRSRPRAFALIVSICLLVPTPALAVATPASPVAPSVGVACSIDAVTGLGTSGGGERSARTAHTAVPATGSPRGATPAAASATVDPVTASVWRGDSARTGEQPGPLPAGSPMIRWQLPKGAIPFARPIAADCAVYAESFEGTIHAVDGTTGTERWQVPADGVGTQIVLADGVLYATGGSDTVVAFAAADGTERWAVDVGRNAFSPVVVGDTVYVGVGHGVDALDAATGAVRWTYAGRAALTPLEMSFGADALVVWILNPSTQDGALVALDPATGGERWQTPIPGIASGAAVVGDAAYVLEKNGVDRVDLATGRSSRVETGDYAWQSNQAVADGVLYATTQDGALHAIDLTAGTERWHIRVQTQALSSPVVVGGAVVVGTTDALTAFDAATGRGRWSVDLPSPAATDPVVVDGLVFVGTTNGDLDAIG